MKKNALAVRPGQGYLDNCAKSMSHDIFHNEDSKQNLTTDLFVHDVGHSYMFFLWMFGAFHIIQPVYWIKDQ